jgi:hypothetical protein
MPAPAVSTIANGTDVGFSTGSTRATSAFSLSAGVGVAVCVRWEESGVTVSSVTDTAGNTYTRVTGSATGDGGRFVEWWVCDNAASGDASNVVTATFSSSAPFFKSVIAFQLDLAVTVDTSASGIGAGANEVISSAFTTTVADALILSGLSRNNSYTETWTMTPGTHVVNAESDGTGSGGWLVTTERTVSAIQTAVTVRGDTTTANNKLISVVALIESGGPPPFVQPYWLKCRRVP